MGGGGGGLVKNLKMVSLRVFKPLIFKAHQKIYLGGSIKQFWKCSRINKLRNLGLPF